MTIMHKIHYRFAARPAFLVAIITMILSLVACGDGAPGATPALSSSPTSVDSPGISTPAPASTTATFSATAGALDSTFGNNGKVTFDLGGHSDELHAVAVQPDGKIVVAGVTYVFPQDRPRFAVARYNANGTLDKAFGDGGGLIVGITDDEYDYSVPYAMALLPNGKILVAGTTYSLDDGHNVFALARFNANGMLDKTFGRGGRVLTAIDTSENAIEDIANAIAIDQDGKIVLAGVTGAFPTDFAAARYLSNGTLDTTFSQGGKTVIDLGGNDRADAVGIQPDGKIVLAGRGANNGDDWAMLRLLPNGKPDSAFGDAGKVSLDFKGGEDRVTGIALRPDGRIMLTGIAWAGMLICYDENGLSRGCDNYGAASAQFKPDGSLDKAFGDGGKALYSYDTETGAYAISLQADGKVVLAGHYDNDDFAVWRVDTKGKLDSKFGDGGMVRTPFGRGMDVAYAVALQSDGKIVAAGTGTLGDNPLNSDFALTRYKP